ncbi:hypothetical protein MCOR03_003589 [Pyricularia oryzae]|nr:hypothetical protein MCOR30_010119 [Pyricularia oryzae]KAI6396019.1 hypothetical protein MCOR24_009195 [Pyricularia oryzae]KAI6468042.1 hypothetical protein MCOR15_002317 [Pyricularia oryzae]KAI6561951.1 hypothetical protein MCOR03_003589 [Pyricularia oryzae]KAI6626472.1 hypothetical protein MCOR08_007188 [Pyricularia oryzae]
MQPILDTSVSPRRPVLSAAASEPSISTLRPVFKDSLNPRHRPAFICSFCHQAHRSFAHVVGESARLTCEGCYRALVDLAVCWKCGELVYRGDACISLGWCFWHRVCFGCLFCGGRTSMQGAWGRGGGGGGEEDWQDEFCTSRGAAVELDEIPLCQHCLLNLAGEGADEDEIVRLALDSAHKGDSQLIRARYEKNKQATSGSDAALPEAQDEPCCQLIMQPFARLGNVDDGIQSRQQCSYRTRAASSPLTRSASVASLGVRNIYKKPMDADKLPSYPSQNVFKRMGLTFSCATDTSRPQIRRQRYSFVSNEPNIRPSLHSQSQRHMQRRHVSFHGLSAGQETRPATLMDMTPSSPVPKRSTSAPEHEQQALSSMDGPAPSRTGTSAMYTTSAKVTRVTHGQKPIPHTTATSKHSGSDEKRQRQARSPFSAAGESSKLLGRPRLQNKARTVTSVQKSTVMQQNVTDRDTQGIQPQCTSSPGTIYKRTVPCKAGRATTQILNVGHTGV